MDLFPDKSDFVDPIIARHKHATLIGLADPTGSLPHGCVFLTGMGKEMPLRVFLTRFPCTEANDGVVANVASYQDIPFESHQFLASLSFGAVVFPLGNDPLPPRINVIWMEIIIFVCGTGKFLRT